MSLADELLANTPNNGLSAALREGIRSLSRDETITFTRYVKVILPADGFIFWVNAALVQPSAMPNFAAVDTFIMDGGNTLPVQRPLPNGGIGIFAPGIGSVGSSTGSVAGPPAPPQTPLGVIVEGSLHYASTVDQREDETITVNRVVFSTKVPIQNLLTTSPDTLWLGEIDGIRFAFSQRGGYYQAAGLNHFVGDAVYPAMETQIIDSVGQISTLQVVSNSLPIWLTLTSQCPMFPSMAVPPNAKPPYGAVHIDPLATEALQQAPFIDDSGTSTQLCSDMVRITFYGLRNNEAIDWMNTFNTFTINNDDLIGVMAPPVPVIRDAKRMQRELVALAIKKTFEARVSYYQRRTQNIAQQLIRQALMTLIVEQP